jgi:tetratricopeptide (TPR) repeat protein
MMDDVAGAAGRQSGLSAELAQLLEQGEALRGEGKFAQAARLFARVLAARPRNVTARLGAGRCAAEQGQHAAALDHFIAATEEQPHIFPLMQFAAAARRAGERDVAERAYRRAAELGPDRAEPMFGLAACAREAGATAVAAEAQAKGCALAPDDGPARVELARDLRALGRLDEARTIATTVHEEQPALKRAVRLVTALDRAAHKPPRDPGGKRNPRASALPRPGPADPTEIRALLDQAEALRTGSNTGEAAVLFDRVIAMRPNSMPARLGAGRCAVAGGALDLALEHFAVATEASGQLWPLMQFAAECRQQGAIDTAQQAWLRAAALMPERAEPRLALAAEARQRGDQAAATDWQQRATVAEPDDSRLRMQLARDLRKLNRLDDAAREVETVLSQQPDQPEALTLAAGIARLRRSRAKPLAPAASASSTLADALALHRANAAWAAAIDLLQSELARRPGNIVARLALGLVQRDSGDAAGALETLRLTYARAPYYLPVLEALGEQFQLAGETARGAALLDRAHAVKAGESAQQLAQRADLALGAGDLPAALDRFETAIARAPDQPSAYIGASHAFARLGQMQAATQILDDAEQTCDPVPALTVRRVQLHRQTGNLAEALALAEAGAAAFPSSFQLWETAINLRIMIADPPDTRARIAASPFTDPLDRAGVAALEGDLAVECGDLAAAIACYRRAAAAAPRDPSVRASLVRAHLAAFDVDAASEEIEVLDALREAGGRRRQRGSTGSESFLGSVVNEYRIDSDVRAQLRALPHQAAARVEPLLALCRLYPDNTMLAGALVDALASSGALAASGASQNAGPPAIPARLMQYWEQASPPDDLQALMDSWEGADTGQSYERFHDATARRFLSTHCDQQAVFAYHRGATGSVRSDLLRLGWLAVEGGVHADVFDACIGPIAPLLPPGAELVLYRGDLGLLSNGFMAARPGHPVLTAAFEQATASVNRGDRDMLWLAMGPGLITRCFAQYLAAEPGALAERLARVRIWSRREVFASVALHCLADWKSTIQPRLTSFTRRAYTVGAPAG